MESEEKLRKIYYDPSHPAAFSSPEKLSKYAHGIPRAIVNQWLLKQNTYTLHKQRRKTFQRNKVVASRVNEQFQADLVDMQVFSRDNKGFKYILTVIDVFSKYAFAVKLKSKNAVDVVSAFKEIFSTRKPLYLQTDKGKEFVNKFFKKLMVENDIVFFTSNNQTIKCSLVERFNRTLKSKMWKYFTTKGTRKWIDVLEKFVFAYNHSVHRATKMRPIDVTFDNSSIAFKNLYGFASEREMLKSLKPVKKSDKLVRIPYEYEPLQKGYYPLWKDQIFKVNDVIRKYPRKIIKVMDQEGKLVQKAFYPEEIQEVQENVYRIEKILRKRSRNGKKEVLIKWLGYPDSYNTWEPAENIQKLHG